MSKPSTPSFLLVGETKCGTSSFFEDLVKHPKICPARKLPNSEVDYTGGKLSLEQKEVRFFDRHWSKGLDWYRNRFPVLEPGQITGEASPTYLYRALSMQRIKATLPDIKIIILLRDPVYRLYSHFHHIAKIAPKWETRYPSFLNYLDTAHENDYYLIDKGCYIKSISLCFELFSPSHILVLRSEDFFNHPRKTYHEAIRFLELEKFCPKQFTHVRSSSPNTPMDEKSFKMLQSFYRQYNQALYRFLERDYDWS